MTLVLARLGALGRREVDRRGQEVDDGVEHGLNALVLEGRAVEDRHADAFQRAVAKGGANVLDGWVVALEDLLQQVVVEGREDVEQLDAVFGGCALYSSGSITSTRSPCSSWWIVAVIRADVDDAQIAALEPIAFG